MHQYGQLQSIQSALLEQSIVEIAGDVDQPMFLYMREALYTLRARGSPEIQIHITSGGGAADDGLDIYDLIRQYPGNKIGIVVGYARSMAAILLQACNRRLALPHARLYIHQSSHSGNVPLDSLRDQSKIDQLRKGIEAWQERLDAILVARTRKSLDEIRTLYAEDRDLNAEEALQFGLIDGIVEHSEPEEVGGAS